MAAGKFNDLRHFCLRHFVGEHAADTHAMTMDMQHHLHSIFAALVEEALQDVDDYTPMEFVVHVLEKFFQKDAESATKIMLHVHHHGIGECGVFTYEIAETKVTQVMDFARKHQHPLQCVMEKK